MSVPFSNTFFLFSQVAASFCVLLEDSEPRELVQLLCQKREFSSFRNLTRCQICKFIFHHVTCKPLNKVGKMGD